MNITSESAIYRRLFLLLFLQYDTIILQEHSIILIREDIYAMKFDYQRSEQLERELIPEINSFFLQYHCKKLHQKLREYAKRNNHNFPEETTVELDFPNDAILLTYSFFGAVPFCTTRTEDRQNKLIALKDFDDL